MNEEAECGMYTVGCYSVSKRKEILSHATKWVNSEDTLLSKLKQSQKNKPCMVPLIYGTWSRNRRYRVVGGGGAGQGKRETFNGRGLLVLQDENILGTCSTA